MFYGGVDQTLFLRGVPFLQQGILLDADVFRLDVDGAPVVLDEIRVATLSTWVDATTGIEIADRTSVVRIGVERRLFRRPVVGGRIDARRLDCLRFRLGDIRVQHVHAFPGRKTDVPEVGIDRAEPDEFRPAWQRAGRTTVCDVSREVRRPVELRIEDRSCLRFRGRFRDGEVACRDIAIRPVQTDARVVPTRPKRAHVSRNRLVS